MSEITKTAITSRCGKFRYRLGRRWGSGAPLLFVMLNPSTADALNDDPTIRRCIGFAKSHGFDAIDVVNLFAYKATSPKDLKRDGYQVGSENDAYIVQAVKNSGAVCVAWGANGVDLERPQVVMPLIFNNGAEALCLAITKKGAPQHPLMARADLRLKPFDCSSVSLAMSDCNRNSRQSNKC